MIARDISSLLNFNAKFLFEKSKKKKHLLHNEKFIFVNK